MRDDSVRITMPSVRSFDLCRIKAFQSNARILGRELPVYLRLQMIPGRHFPTDLLHRLNTSVQTLLHHDVDLAISAKFSQLLCFGV